MEIRLANEKDLSRLNKLFEEIVYDLTNIKKIEMWNEIYPFCEFKNDILNHDMYVLEEQNEIIGSFVLNEYDDPDYKKIEWTSDNKKKIYLNRLAILPSQQGKGYAKKAMKFIEQYAADNDFEVIRLTVLDKNKYAIGLYEKLGFVKVEKGYWELDDKKFIGYEKII